MTTRKQDEALTVFYREAFEEGTLWITYDFLRREGGWTAHEFAERIERGMRDGEFGLYVYGPNDEFIDVPFDPNRKDIDDYWKTLNFSPNDKTTELYNVYYERTRS